MSSPGLKHRLSYVVVVERHEERVAAVLADRPAAHVVADPSITFLDGRDDYSVVELLDDASPSSLVAAAHDTALGGGSEGGVGGSGALENETECAAAAALGHLPFCSCTATSDRCLL